MELTPFSLGGMCLVRCFKRAGHSFGVRRAVRVNMTVAFIWLVLAVACGWCAVRRGRSGWAWWVAAMLLSPIVASVVLLLLPAHASAETRHQVKRCQQCDPRGERTAGECTHCLMSAPFHL